MSTPITENDLHAWLDSELGAERRAEVEAWLRDHPEDAARVRLWAADGTALRTQLEGVLVEPVPQRLSQVVWNRAPTAMSAPWLRWAAAALLFAGGGLAGAAMMWQLQSHTVAQAPARTGPDAGWVQRAAVAHTVYTPEVRHPVEVRAQEEHLARWLTKRLDVPVKLFDLRAQGFELIGGRLLPDAAGPSAQLMYQAVDAPAPGTQPERVTVYLRKPEVGTPAAFRYEQEGRLGTFYWVEGGTDGHGAATGYALTGTLPRERLLALAEAIYRQMPVVEVPAAKK